MTQPFRNPFISYTATKLLDVTETYSGEITSLNNKNPNQISVKRNGIHSDVFKDKIQGLNQSNIS